MMMFLISIFHCDAENFVISVKRQVCGYVAIDPYISP